MRVYLDSAPVIYLVEGTRTLQIQPDAILVASDLTRLECRVKPIREGNQRLLRVYERFFGSAIDQITPLSPEVIDLATEIRAEFGFTTPDSIHLAAAIAAECDEFLTNDRRLRRFNRIRVTAIDI